MPTFDDLKQALAAAKDDAERGRVIRALVENYLPYLRSLAGPRIDERAQRHFDSEDIGQTIAWRLLERFEQGGVRLDTEAQFKAYLKKIVRNRISDKRDRFAKQSERPVDESAGTFLPGAAAVAPADQGDSPSLDAGQAETVDLLLAAISRQLRPDELAMYKARHIEGKEYTAIAAELGLAPDAVRMRLNRIQQKLRDSLKGIERRLYGE